MSTQLRKALSSNLLFKNIDLDEIDLSGVQGKLSVLKEGQYVYRKDEEALYLYMIVNGRVKSLIEDNQGNKYLRNYDYPEYFGHIELFDEGLRRGDIVAVEDSFIIGLTKDEVLFLASQDRRIRERLNIKDENDVDNREAEIESEIDSGFTAQIEHDIEEVEEDLNIEEERFEEVFEEAESDEQSPLSRSADEGSVREETRDLTGTGIPGAGDEIFTGEEFESGEAVTDDYFETSEPDVPEGSFPSEIPEEVEHEFDNVLENIRRLYSKVDYREVLSDIHSILESSLEAEDSVLLSLIEGNMEILSARKNFNVVPMVSYEDSIVAEALEGKVVIQNETDNPDQLGNFVVLPDSYEIKNFVLYPVENGEGKISMIILILNSESGIFADQDIQELERLSPHILNSIRFAGLFKDNTRNIRFTNFAKFQNFFSNDIKKPLLISKRYIEHLLSKNPSDDIRKLLLMINEQIKTASQRFMAVTNYSQSEESLKKIPVMINNLIDRYLTGFEHTAKTRNIELVKVFGKDHEVKVDVKELEYAFNHLMNNSIESIKEGGKITVKTGLSKEHVTVTVADDGCGIPSVVLSEIFLPFYSFNKPENTGIGLTIAKKIIEKHGGTVQLTSEEEKGTEVVVLLPKSSGF